MESINGVLPNDVGAAVDILDNTLHDLHKTNKIKVVRATCRRSKVMETADKAFDDYLKALNEPDTIETVLQTGAPRQAWRARATRDARASRA